MARMVGAVSLNRRRAARPMDDHSAAKGLISELGQLRRSDVGDHFRSSPNSDRGAELRLDSVPDWQAISART
jgi:hypothetical protein